MKSILRLIMSVLIFAVAVAQPTATENIIEVARKEGFTTLLSLLEKAGLTSVFETDDQFTILAPTEEAFAALDPALLARIKSNTELQNTVLMAHVVNSKMPSKSFVDDMTANAMLNGYKLKFSKHDDGVEVNGAKIIKPDMTASNGVIHSINKVIIPQKKGDSTEDSSLADRDDTEHTNLMQMLTMKGFSTMTSLLSKTGMTSLFEGKEIFTLLVPTEEAFMNLDPNLLTQLMMNVTLLKTVLMAHAVRGALPPNKLSDGMEIETLLDGYKLMVSLKKSRGKVNGANIILSNVKASNGIIYVIDKVIIPDQQIDSENGPLAEPEPKVEPEPESESKLKTT